jgi:phenylalanyl-tRNA synthetase alpha chain
VQIHLMEEAVRNDSLPIHAVMPGKCFRLDTPDARHLAVFNQIEGLVVDRGITFGDLAGTIQTFTTAYFGDDMHSRLRPAYFPFTEPSAELEITCAICRGSGCRTCSQTGWVELGGCGMVDPAVFAAVGIDPDEWSGFAFGFGIDRCATKCLTFAPSWRTTSDSCLSSEIAPSEKDIRARSTQLAP